MVKLEKITAHFVVFFHRFSKKSIQESASTETFLLFSSFPQVLHEAGNSYLYFQVVVGFTKVQNC